MVILPDTESEKETDRNGLLSIVWKYSYRGVHTTQRQKPTQIPIVFYATLSVSMSVSVSVSDSVSGSMNRNPFSISSLNLIIFAQFIPKW